MSRLLSLHYGLCALMLALVTLAMAALFWAGGWAHVGARNALLLVLLLGIAVTVAAGVGAALLWSARRPAVRLPPPSPPQPPAPSPALDTTVQAALLGQHLAAAGQLCGRVAHDLGNLLGTINTSAQLIERRNADAEVALLVDSIHRSVETASRLAQQLPRLARHQPQPPRRIELAEELPKQRELLQTVLGQQVRLTIEVAPDAGAIEADTGELTLALVNLAFNASQAIRRATGAPQARGMGLGTSAGAAPGTASGATLGQVRLIARAASAEPGAAMPPGACALICMVDDGIGIDEALVARAFEPFFSTRPAGSGSGLGLSQVAAFCERAGGLARLRSTPGLGTAVSLLLPVAPPPAAAAGAAFGTAPEFGWLSGRHVLVVDPSDDFAGFVAALLAGHGCRLSRAQDARQALEAFEPGRVAVDLALCAAELPDDIDGLALARLLRRRDPRLAIVLRGTAAVPGGDRDPVALPWPCTPSQLLGALQQATR